MVIQTCLVVFVVFCFVKIDRFDLGHINAQELSIVGWISDCWIGDGDGDGGVVGKCWGRGGRGVKGVGKGPVGRYYWSWDQIVLIGQ